MKEQQKEVKAEYGAITKELKEERKAHQDFVEGIYRWMTVFVSVLAVLSGGLFVLFGWNRFRQVNKDVDTLVTNKCTKMLADVVSGKRDIILEQLKKYDRQAYLRKNKPILILDDTDNGNAHEVVEHLKGLGFNIDRDKIGDYLHEDGTLKEELKDRDVVVFYRLGQSWMDESIQTNIVDGLKNKAILFYLSGQFFENNKHFNVNAVQMPGQLYGNLMNLLEYIDAKQHG